MIYFLDKADNSFSEEITEFPFVFLPGLRSVPKCDMANLQIIFKVLHDNDYAINGLLVWAGGSGVTIQIGNTLEMQISFLHDRVAVHLSTKSGKKTSFGLPKNFTDLEFNDGLVAATKVLIGKLSSVLRPNPV